MFEKVERKSIVKHIVFYIFVACMTIIVMVGYTLSFRSNLDEAEKCGYDACILVVNNADTSKAELLSCRCQCESTQVLTDECQQRYECTRTNECWGLKSG